MGGKPSKTDVHQCGGFVPGPEAWDSARVVGVYCKGIYFAGALEHCFCEVHTDNGAVATLELVKGEKDGFGTCYPDWNWGRYTRRFFSGNDSNKFYTRCNFDGAGLTVRDVKHVFEACDQQWSCDTEWRTRHYNVVGFNCHTYAENICCALFWRAMGHSVPPFWLYNQNWGRMGWRGWHPGNANYDAPRHEIEKSLSRRGNSWQKSRGICW